VFLSCFSYFYMHLKLLGTSHMELPTCRYCFEPSASENALGSFCQCKGSVKWVHTLCLTRRLETIERGEETPPPFVCELCNATYSNVVRRRTVRHRLSQRGKELVKILVVSIFGFVTSLLAILDIWQPPPIIGTLMTSLTMSYTLCTLWRQCAQGARPKYSSTTEVTITVTAPDDSPV
jgi:hypothetical protein